jgi:hypothetical protein
MNCNGREIYLQTLHNLQAEGVQFCVIGTFGLGLHDVIPSSYEIKDCDLAVKADSENLNHLARILETLQWQLYVWDEPVHYPLPLEKLWGKYYLRAVFRNMILDATYECAVSWPELKEQICYREELPVASIFHMLHMKKRRNTPKDLHIVEQVLTLLNQR